jgi:hypothetical protein
VPGINPAREKTYVPLPMLLASIGAVNSIVKFALPVLLGVKYSAGYTQCISEAGKTKTLPNSGFTQYVDELRVEVDGCVKTVPPGMLELEAVDLVYFSDLSVVSKEFR